MPFNSKQPVPPPPVVPLYVRHPPPPLLPTVVPAPSTSLNVIAAATVSIAAAASAAISPADPAIAAPAGPQAAATEGSPATTAPPLGPPPSGLPLSFLSFHSQSALPPPDSPSLKAHSSTAGAAGAEGAAAVAAAASTRTAREGQSKTRKSTVAALKSVTAARTKSLKTTPNSNPPADKTTQQNQVHASSIPPTLLEFPKQTNLPISVKGAAPPPPPPHHATPTIHVHPALTKEQNIAFANKTPTTVTSATATSATTAAVPPPPVFNPSHVPAPPSNAERRNTTSGHQRAATAGGFHPPPPRTVGGSRPGLVAPSAKIANFMKARKSSIGIAGGIAGASVGTKANQLQISKQLPNGPNAVTLEPYWPPPPPSSLKATRASSVPPPPPKRAREHTQARTRPMSLAEAAARGLPSG